MSHHFEPVKFINSCATLSLFNNINMINQISHLLIVNFVAKWRQ